MKVPRWAPASRPWEHRPSAPASAATRASSGCVTVTSTREPASRSDRTTSRGGQPNVKLTSGTGAVSRTSSFAAQSSSSHAGSPSAAPAVAASWASEPMYRAVSAGSAVGRPGTKTLTPNAPAAAARTALISAAIAAAVL